MKKLLTSVPLQIGVATLLVVGMWLAAFASVPTTRAQGESTARVAVAALNLRAGPGLSFRVLDVLPRAEEVALQGRNTNAAWVEVDQAAGPDGWMYAPYLETEVDVATLPVTDATVAPGEALAVVSVTQLNVHAGPGALYPVLDTVNQFEAVSLLGRSNDALWVAVNQDDGANGWMYAPSLETSVAISSLPIVEASGGPLAPLPEPELVTFPLYSIIENDIADVYLQDYPARTNIVVTLARVDRTAQLVMAEGLTDANGTAQFTFAMPDRWPDGDLVAENQLVLTAATPDGSFSRTAVIDYFRFFG